MVSLPKKSMSACASHVHLFWLHGTSTPYTKSHTTCWNRNMRMDPRFKTQDRKTHCRHKHGTC
jgi:hypothetical protein